MKKYIYSKLSVVRICLLASFLFAFHADSPLSLYTIPIAAYSIDTADLDMDGDIDIVTGHLYNSQTHWSGISIIKNNSYGYFNLEDSIYFFGWQSVLCEQLDNDSLPEIIMKKETTNTEYIGILYNNNYADSLFLNTNKYDGIEGITSGDIDGNGYKDIAFYCSEKQYWGVFYNYGYRNFSPPEFHTVTGTYPSNIVCGDLNGDGRDDVALGGQITEVFYSLPTGFLQVVLESNNYKDMLAIVDFDGDGDNDLITAVGIPFVNITSLIMYRNENNISLQVLPEVYFQTPSTKISTNDFNYDNLPDIAFLTMFPDTSGTGIKDTIGGIEILYNQGNFQLSNPQFISLTNYDEGSRDFHSADFDGNGYNDFAIIRGSGAPMMNLELLFNDGNGNFIGTPVGMHDRLDKSKSESLSCYPNPFHESTSFKINLPNTAQVELSVYDLNGRLVQCITNKKMAEGHHVIKWQGPDKANILNKKNVLIVCLKFDGNSCQSFKLIWY